MRTTYGNVHANACLYDYKNDITVWFSYWSDVHLLMRKQVRFIFEAFVAERAMVISGSQMLFLMPLEIGPLDLKVSSVFLTIVNDLSQPG
jgi:hypothetical protein